MFDRITEFFIDIEDDGVTQSQREALIDLLIWTMYIDNSIKFEENAKLDQVLRSLNWESPLQVNQYLGMAYSRVRQAIDDGSAQDALLSRLHERLGNPEMRRKAWEFSQDLAMIDSDLSDEEKDFLDRVRQGFQLQD